MKSGYVVFELPVVLNSGMDRFRNSIPEPEFSTLRKNGYVVTKNIPLGLQHEKIFFYKKYKSSDGDDLTAYVVNIEGYRVAIASLDGPLQEISCLPEELFEL